MLEQHPATAAHSEDVRFAHNADIQPKNLNDSGAGRLKQDHLAHQHGLAAAVSTGDSEYFAFVDGETYVLMNHGASEARRDMPDLDERQGGLGEIGSGSHICHQLNRIEKNAAETMTRKIPWTTLRVVWRPTLSTPPKT